MSYAKVTQADPDNNAYSVNIPGIDSFFEFSAQNITYRELVVGQTVELIDINNWPPFKSMQLGNLRLRERDVRSNARFHNPSELYSKSPASLAYGFIYASERNRRWQEECPLYRKGIVQIIHNPVDMTVRIEDYGFYPDLRCPTDYFS